MRGFGRAFEAIIRHLVELGFKGQFIGDLTISLPEIISNTKNALEGAYLVSIELDTESKSPFIQDYIKRYKQRYNEVPSFWDAWGFDSCIYLMKAIEKSENENISVSDALNSIDSIELLLGNNMFRNKLDVEFEMDIFRIENGKAIK